jgi:hypothetical protein
MTTRLIGMLKNVSLKIDLYPIPLEPVYVTLFGKKKVFADAINLRS